MTKKVTPRALLRLHQLDASSGGESNPPHQRQTAAELIGGLQVPKLSEVARDALVEVAETRRLCRPTLADVEALERQAEERRYKAERDLWQRQYEDARAAQRTQAQRDEDLHTLAEAERAKLRDKMAQRAAAEAKPKRPRERGNGALRQKVEDFQIITRLTILADHLGTDFQPEAYKAKEYAEALGQLWGLSEPTIDTVARIISTQNPTVNFRSKRGAVDDYKVIFIKDQICKFAKLCEAGTVQAPSPVFKWTSG